MTADAAGSCRGYAPSRRRSCAPAMNLSRGRSTARALLTRTSQPVDDCGGDGWLQVPPRAIYPLWALGGGGGTRYLRYSRVSVVLCPILLRLCVWPRGVCRPGGADQSRMFACDETFRRGDDCAVCGGAGWPSKCLSAPSAIYTRSLGAGGGRGICANSCECGRLAPRRGRAGRGARRPIWNLTSHVLGGCGSKAVSLRFLEHLERADF
jgi:hypothetical protein